MKLFVRCLALVVLATLNTHCAKRSSASTTKAADLTVVELQWEPKSLKGLETSLPGALGKVFEGADKSKDTRFTCKDSGAVNARDCAIKAAASKDSIMCTYRIPAQPNRIEVYCEIKVSAWPQLAPELANVIAPEFIRLGFAKGPSFTSKGREGEMSCQEASGDWQCSLANFVQLDQGITTPKKQSIKVPEGLKDEFGAPLPTRSQDYVLNLPSGSIKVATYRAPDEVLAAFMEAMADEKNLSIDEESDAPRCKDAEKIALTYYTADGYKLINTGLRKLAQGEKPAREVELAILAAISGVNCAGLAKEHFVIRGANLSAEKLAKYQKDAIIVEHAFTSTSIDTEVLADFRGNTEFRIIEARGANLSDFGVWSENGERELLIAPGTLFKVLDRRAQGNTTIIELQQLP
jgi:hypothetical protein